MDPFELLIEAHRPGLKAALARLVSILRKHDVRYVIGGANALSLYVRPRSTIDIDAFVDISHKQALDETLSAAFEVVNTGRFQSKFRQGGRRDRHPVRRRPRGSTSPGITPTPWRSSDRCRRWTSDDCAGSWSASSPS